MATWIGRMRQGKIFGVIDTLAAAKEVYRWRKNKMLSNGEAAKFLNVPESRLHYFETMGGWPQHVHGIISTVPHRFEIKDLYRFVDLGFHGEELVARVHNQANHSMRFRSSPNRIFPMAEGKPFKEEVRWSIFEQKLKDTLGVRCSIDDEQIHIKYDRCPRTLEQVVEKIV